MRKLHLDVCPFCNGKATINEDKCITANSFWTIQCDKCCVCMADADEETAVRKWNTRQSSAIEAARHEIASARASWPPFNSAHEGFSVLKEEADELWDEVKVNQKRRDLEKMRKEAIQVAAMAIRFAEEVCDEINGRK